MIKTSNSAKLTVAAIILIITGSAAPLFGQNQLLNLLIPPVGTEEAAFIMFPVGGWNTLGTFSPKAAAMGETFFSSPGPSAGLLNPAFLSRLESPRISLSYRYSGLSYKTESGPQIMTLDSDTGDLTATFRRKTGYLDGIGLALPFMNWTFAANVSIFQEFNAPDISGSMLTMPSKVKQSGEMRGVNLAVARSLGDSFSIGVSASYLYGRISRYEVVPLIYWMKNSRGTNQVLSAALRQFLSNLLVVVPEIVSDSDIDLNGFAVNFGFSCKMKDDMLFGLSLRAPFVIHLKDEVDYSWTGLSLAHSRYSLETDFKQPLVATASLLFLPTPSFSVTADVSYWDWKNGGSDGRSIRTNPTILNSVIKLNLGAEYRIDLPLKDVKSFALRAGFIHDPQPYLLAKNAVRNFVCAGFGLGIGRFQFDAAAKINLFDPDQGRFQANVFSAGLSCDF